MSFNNHDPHPRGYYGEDEHEHPYHSRQGSTMTNGHARNGNISSAKQLYEQRKNGMDMTPHTGQLTEYYVEVRCLVFLSY